MAVRGSTLDRPVQVRWAVILLSVSLIAGVIVGALEFDSTLFSEMDDFMGWFVAMALGTYILFGILIFLVWRRHNWARVLILVLTVVGAIILFIPWPGIEADPWTVPEIASQVGFFLLDGVALFWLFTGAGAAWFARKKPAPI